MNKKILFASILASLISFSTEDKIKGEIYYGIKSEFGIDGANETVKFIPSIIKLVKPIEFEDYDKIQKSSTNVEYTSDNNENEIFIPKINNKKRDLYLASKYLSDNIKNSRSLNFKLSEKYFNTSLELNLKGERIKLDNFFENNKIDEAKLTLTANNDYVKGYIIHNIKGIIDKDYGIDKIDKNENLLEKQIKYEFNVLPFRYKKLVTGISFNGIDKNLEIGPHFEYNNNSFYLKASFLFNNGKKDDDVVNEISKIENIVPGNSKIEYFKNWTLKEEKVDLSNKENYENDFVDILKAEVSGYKGTKRILGLPSGSLFGDNPIRYISKKFIDEINSNPNFENTSSMLKDVEKGSLINIGLGEIFSFFGNLISSGTVETRVGKMQKELSNTKNLDEMINKISPEIYDRIGVSLNKKYARNGLWNQIPNEFRNIIPGLNEFSILNINADKLNPDYLYLNGMLPKLINNNTSTVENSDKDYKLVNRYHYIDDDVLKYVTEPIFKKYKPTNVSAFSKIIKDPVSMGELDIFRGLYLHLDEKSRNKFELKKELDTILSDLDKNYKTLSTLPKLKLNVGYINNKLNFDTEFILNDNIKLMGNNFSYSKNSNSLNLFTEFKIKGFFINSLINSKYSVVNFNKNDDIKIKYNTLDLNTYTNLGYVFKPNKKWDIELSLKHLGEYGYIIPKEFKINSENKKFKVAKRDNKGNPIGLDNISIKVNETTEEALIDKLHKLDDTKSKRDLHASDYILKEEKVSEKGIYKNLNIIAPNLTLRYRPYENIEISNSLETALSIVDKNPSGLRFVYNGGIKYLLNQNDFNLLDEDKFIKFKTLGNIKLGYDINDKTYLKYKAKVDLSFAKLETIGRNNNFKYDFRINPLILDLTLKPRIIVESNLKNTYLGYGLEFNSRDFSSIIGFKKKIRFDENEFEKALKYNIMDVIDHRKDPQSYEIKEKLDNLFITKEMKYIDLPFIELRKDDGEYKFRFRTDVDIASAYDFENKTIEGQFEYDNEEKLKGDYIGWNVKESGWFSSKYIYYKKIHKTKYDKLVKLRNQIKEKKYNYEFELSREKEKGFNFSFDTRLKYSNLSNRIYEKEIEKTKVVERELYGILGTSTSSYKLEDYKDDNKVLLDEDNLLLSIENYAVSKKSKKPIYIGTGYKKANNENLKEKLGEKVISTNEKLDNTDEKLITLVENKNINFNISTYLGYNFNPKDKMILGVGLNHKLNINYSSIDNLKIEDFRVYPSSKLIIKNEISPTIKFSYDIYKGLKFNSDLSLKFNLEGKKYKNTKLGINGFIEYRW